MWVNKVIIIIIINKSRVSNEWSTFQFLKLINQFYTNTVKE